MAIIAFLQSLGDWLIAPMCFFSFLGTVEFYLLLIPTLYWCWGPALGLRIGLLLLLSNGVNDTLKVALHSPRPYWVSAKIRALAVETSFGIPSGHSQHAVVIWGAAARLIGRRWAWIVAVALAFLIGLSRMVLAVHFPTDVLLGWTVGALIVSAWIKFEAPLIRWWGRLTPLAQVGVAFVVSLAILGVRALVLASLGGWQVPAAWLDTVAAHGIEELPDPLNSEGILTTAGTLFGLLIGLVWLNPRGGFTPARSLWRKASCLLLGVVGVVILRFGLKLILGDEPTLLGDVFRYVRYTLIGAWVSAGAPWVFGKLGLVPNVEAQLK